MLHTTRSHVGCSVIRTQMACCVLKRCGKVQLSERLEVEEQLVDTDCESLRFKEEFKEELRDEESTLGA
jgi:hypothetical protein